MTNTQVPPVPTKIDRDAQGRFLPGNSYMAPRWVKGQSGKPARYTPRKLEHAITGYVNMCLEQGIPIGRAGLAVALGMTTPALLRYTRGEIGKTDDDRAGCSFVLEAFNTLIEAQIESRLDSKDYATSGLIFKAKNLFPDRWQDTRNIHVNHTEQMKLVVELDPTSKLFQRLQESGGVEVIEGECEVVDIAPASGECTTADSD